MANISSKYSTVAQPEYWHWHSRGPRFQNYTDTSKSPLYSHIHFPPSLPTTQLLVSTNLFSISKILSLSECYVTFRIRNFVVCNLLRSARFTQHESLDIHPGCCLYQYFFPLHCCVIFHGMIEMYESWFNHSPTERHQSCLGLLRIKLLSTFRYSKYLN